MAELTQRFEQHAILAARLLRLLPGKAEEAETDADAFDPAWQIPADGSWTKSVPPLHRVMPEPDAEATLADPVRQDTSDAAPDLPDLSAWRDAPYLTQAVPVPEKNTPAALSRMFERDARRY